TAGSSAFAAAAVTAAAPPAPALPPGVVVSRDGGDLFAPMGTRTYRVRGWEPRRTADTPSVALRLRVATHRGDRLHHDRLDLYQTRQRSAFVAAAAEETGIAADVLKADLGALILVVEEAETTQRRQAAAATAATPAAPAVTLTAEERA